MWAATSSWVTCVALGSFEAECSAAAQHSVCAHSTVHVTAGQRCRPPAGRSGQGATIMAIRLFFIRRQLTLLLLVLSSAELRLALRASTARCICSTHAVHAHAHACMHADASSFPCVHVCTLAA